MWQSVGTVAALYGAPWAIVTYIVVQIIRGKLIPRSVHVDRVNDLKAANAALEETVDELRRQQAILLGRPTS